MFAVTAAAPDLDAVGGEDGAGETGKKAQRTERVISSGEQVRLSLSPWGPRTAQMFPPIQAEAVRLGQIDLNSPESSAAAPVSPNRRCGNFVRKMDVPRFNFSIV